LVTICISSIRNRPNSSCLTEYRTCLVKPTQPQPQTKKQGGGYSQDVLRSFSSGGTLPLEWYNVFCCLLSVKAPSGRKGDCKGWFTLAKITNASISNIDIYNLSLSLYIYRWTDKTRTLWELIEWEDWWHLIHFL
jgi:hypothetical protein